MSTVKTIKMLNKHTVALCDKLLVLRSRESKAALNSN